MAHFAVALFFVAVALPCVQRTAWLLYSGEGLSERGVTPAIENFDILDLKWCVFRKC